MDNSILEQLKKQVSEVIRHSQGIENPLVDTLIDEWYKAKEDFIDAMGGRLRVCLPDVSFNLSEKNKEEKVIKFADDVCERYGFPFLKEFILYNKNTFFENTVSEVPGWCELRKIDVKKGMKLLKSFKFFIDNKETLEQIQNEASMIIQEDKIEGDMFISVHPLDFLSSSENNHNWRSCHALDGEYRCGNLSYMCDSSTVIVYLCSKGNVKLPRFPESVPWNDKRWRMLLHFSNRKTIVFASRQYPFFCREALDIVKEKLLPEIVFINEEKEHWCNWSNILLNSVYDEENDEKYYFDYTYIPIDGKLLKLEDYVKDASYSTHFNDVKYSSCYKPYYSKLKEDCLCFGDIEKTQSKNEYVMVGSATNCLHCNAELVAEHDLMICNNCFSKYYSKNPLYYRYGDLIRCVNCGELFSEEEICYIEDEPYCRDCYDDLRAICDRCGCAVLQDNLIYDEREDQYICIYCKEYLDEREKINNGTWN